MPSQAKIQRISKQDLIITQNPMFMCIYVENVTLKICADSLEATGNSHQGPKPETNDNIAFWHFQHEDGTVLDGKEIKKIHKEAKIQWKLLSDKYGDIGSPWTTVSPTPQLNFCLRMEDKFPLLHLCDDHYKALTIVYTDYSHQYLTWVKSKMKCKCPCKCRARSKTKSKSKGKSKSPSKFKYKYTSLPKSKSKSKFKYKYKDKEEDKDKTESKSQCREGTTHHVLKMQEESKDNDMEDDKGQGNRDKEDKEEEDNNNNNNNNSESDKGDSSDDTDANGDNNLNLLHPPEPPLFIAVHPFSCEAEATHHTSRCKQQGEVNAMQGTICPDTFEGETEGTPHVHQCKPQGEVEDSVWYTRRPPMPIVNPTAPAPSNDTGADTTNFNPNPLANVVWTTSPTSAPDNMDTCEDEGPDRQHNSGSNSGNVPLMAPPSKVPTPTPDAGAPEVRTLMAPPSKALTPAPDAGTSEARTLMAVSSRAPTPVPTRGTLESRHASAALLNNALTPGPSGSISNSRHATTAPLSNAPTPGPSSSILESGLGTNSNTLREGKGKAKKPVPMHPGKAKTARNLYAINYLKVHSVTREEFTKVWVNLDEATKEIYKQQEMDMKSTAESSLA
ncbi:hypothetical protein EI94DRAFT_1794924 [Lactarius quietus]|nr:hypothetical protein EI94DRAFT_1794924 [Lactarius quietus]